MLIFLRSWSPWSSFFSTFSFPIYNLRRALYIEEFIQRSLSNRFTFLEMQNFQINTICEVATLGKRFFIPLCSWWWQSFRWFVIADVSNPFFPWFTLHGLPQNTLQTHRELIFLIIDNIEQERRSTSGSRTLQNIGWKTFVENGQRSIHFTFSSILHIL